MGLLRLDKDAGNGVYGVEFLPSPSPAGLTLLPPMPPAQEVPPDRPAAGPGDIKPQYALEELEIYKNNNAEIKDYFAMAENMLGRMLKYDDLNTLFALYDWLRLPIEVIEILLVYCANNHHRNIRYIEKMAVDWAENGVDTPEKAEEYMHRMNKGHREFMRALGLREGPTPAQSKFIQHWLDRLPLEVVLDACDKTMMSIGKPKFSYLESILDRWHQAGIQTVEDVKAAEEAYFKNKKEEAQQKAPRQTHKRNRFVNFTQREWDYDQIEALSQLDLERVAGAGKGT